MDLFSNGAAWLKADFHLHTKADAYFKYSGSEDEYYSCYVNALKKAGIAVGAVTNHNKFDKCEYEALRKTAKKQEILLMPGVELSVGDGNNGIHTLIVFSDEWLSDADYINQFLSVSFRGSAPSQYENKCGRSSMNLNETFETLENYQKDFFIVFAHVEQDSGLWVELDGGRTKELGVNEYFRKRVLGFQKVRTHDKRLKVKEDLGESYPAEVEGSDPKSIDEIGKTDLCCLKLGELSYEAVKFAMSDHLHRLSKPQDCVPKYTHSHIRQICFEGGTLGGQTIRFSPELNTLIGIRGSGKSSILEAMRYALGIRIDENDNEYKYKNELTALTLGSGGRVVLDATNRCGQDYQIRRIWNEMANVFIDDKLQPGVSIFETVLYNPLFFGQKELAASDKGSEKNLIEKLLGTKCDEIRRQIAAQKVKVTDLIGRMYKVKHVDEDIEEQTKLKQDAEHQLQFYKKHDLEGKLKKRLGYEKDLRKSEEGIALIEAFTDDVRELLANHEDELRSFEGYASAENPDFFRAYNAIYSQVIAILDSIKTGLTNAESLHNNLKAGRETLVASKAGLAEEFATMERVLAEELKTQNVSNISTDKFLSAQQKLAAAHASLAALFKNKDQKAALQNELKEELQRLNDLWNQEYQIIKRELEEVSVRNDALKFSAGLREDRDAFLDFLQTTFKGSGVRKVTYQTLAEKYGDYTDIYRDWENAKKLLGSNSVSFEDLFEKNLGSLLTYQIPNKYSISYHGVELAHHSLGQRASALLLFVLGQKGSDVIIIDQPEDDIDNQTIYEDVITLIRALKPSMQFILATHNPNIPVLGDAEQIHACSFKDGAINVQSSGIDNREQQKRIVKIMEGGIDAFKRRKEIYESWKP